MRRAVFFFAIALCAAASIASGQAKYEPTWESLDTRPTPAWFDEAKFGIFIHWGVYSVPAWSPKGMYSEWYWQWLNQREEVRKFHNETYGEKFAYENFAPMFKAELFNPEQWAEIFAKSGAKYVVLTSKHHEGFCLWPSAQSWNWNSVDIGPHRDLCGDLTRAVKAKGLKMGFYYSFYEWYNPLYRSDPEQYVEEHMLPQLKDLVTRYEPSLVWPDGEWEHPPDLWRSTEFLAWLFNESTVKDEVAVNDRWGKGARGQHGGFYTTEYGRHAGEKAGKVAHKWEECRGMGASFGFNRNEEASDYVSTTGLLHLLINTVSNGGNLLLNIGPTADGRIPVIMQDRLVEMGEWLKVNGEAIYGTTPWRTVSDGELVRYTVAGSAGALTPSAGGNADDDIAAPGIVYAICLKWPGDQLTLTEPKPSKNTSVALLGVDGHLKWRSEDGKMIIEVPKLSVDEVPCRHAYVFKLTGLNLIRRKHYV